MAGPQKNLLVLWGCQWSLCLGLFSGEGELIDQVASRIGEALDTSAGLWLGLHHDYLAWKGAQDAIVDCQKEAHARNHMVAAYFLELWRRALEQQTVTITLCNMTRT